MATEIDKEALTELGDLEEKRTFSGLCFMLNGKMCTSAGKHDLMCRIDPEQFENVISKYGCKEIS